MAKQTSALHNVFASKDSSETTEVENQPQSLIARVYLIKKTGIEMVEGADAESHIKAILEASKGDDAEYVFYEDKKPVYVAIQNGTYQPLRFPEPGPDPDKGQTGLTSIDLYAWAVTLAGAIEKIIEGETEPKPSLLDQARKVMTPTIVIVACVIAIFLITALIKG